MAFKASLYQIAKAVWNLVALADRTVTPSGGTITTVTTATNLTTNNDKDDYNLSSSSRGTIKQKIEGTSTIASPNTSNTESLGVTVVKANSELRYLGFTSDCNATNLPANMPRVELLDTENVRATRNGTSDTTIVGFEVTEWNG